MAFIMGQKEQQAALKEIKSACKEIENTNKFLAGKNSSGKFTIIFTADDGTRCSAVAFAPSKEEIDRFVSHEKQLVTQHVTKLADDNRILLDIDEKELFGIPLTASEQEELDARLTAELEKAEANAAGTQDGSEQPYEDEDLSSDPDGDVD